MEAEGLPAVLLDQLVEQVDVAGGDSVGAKTAVDVAMQRLAVDVLVESPHDAGGYIFNIFISGYISVL